MTEGLLRGRDGLVDLLGVGDIEREAQRSVPVAGDDVLPWPTPFSTGGWRAVVTARDPRSVA